MRGQAMSTEPNFQTQHAQERAFEAGREKERNDLMAWLEQGDGYENIIDLIKQGAHEGAAE